MPFTYFFMKRIFLCLSLFVFLCGCISTEPTCKSPYLEYQKGSCCLDANGNGICDSDDVVTTAQEITTTLAAASTTIAGEEFKCSGNYYEYMSGQCCLDINHNEVCDSDETTTLASTTISVSTTTASATTTTFRIIIPMTLVTIPLNFDCAQHFTKIDTDEMSLCGGGSMGGDPITGSYGCRADPNYPLASSCPAGTEMNNVYGYAAGSTPGYSCYVPQDIGASEAPAGCPISTVQCADKFTYDSASSHLSWSGGGSSWGCYFSCKANPDPYDSNEDWPCTKTGYKPIGGGGGDTCCAIW